jgi:hypothetical protein
LYYPILREGLEVKKHSEIIKGFSLFFLLFVLVSAVAVSQDTNGEFTETIAVFGNDSVSTSNEEGTTFYKSTNGETSEISVTIVDSSSSEDVDDTDTADTNTADTNTADTNTAESTDSVDSNANGNPDPGIIPPNSNPDGLVYEEWSTDEWWEWVLSTVTSEDIMLPPLSSVEDTIDFTATVDIR